MREQDVGCCQIFRAEFHRKQFSLHHDEPTDFCRSQWQRGKRSIIWLLYRWILAAFFTAGVLSSLVQQWMAGRWWIYLTDWGFLLCMYTFSYGAVITTCYFFNQNYFAPGSRALKIYWASHFTTLILAALITLVFWSFLFPEMPEIAGDLYNIWAHALNSVLMILDHMLVAFPTRMMHFIYPFVVGFIYGLFSLFYYLAGGTDAFGNNFIYPILKWSAPGLAVGTVIGCMVLVVIFVVLFFYLYRFRHWLHGKCCQKTTASEQTIEKA